MREENGIEAYLGSPVLLDDLPPPAVLHHNQVKALKARGVRACVRATTHYRDAAFR